MVSIDIDRGTEILEALDRAKLKVNVAIWMYLSEYDDWRFVLAGRDLDFSDAREGYRLIFAAMEAAGVDSLRLPPLLLLPMSDSMVRELRRLFGKTKSVLGMRLGGQSFGDRFVEDAYVYRIV